MAGHLATGGYAGPDNADGDFDKAEQLREGQCGPNPYSDEEESDSGDDSGDDCSEANWGVLWENQKGEMQGGNCVVNGEIWAENCDCSDPKNYNYGEGRF